MMIQATIPSALGLFYTPWLFDTPLLASGVVTTFSVAVLWFMFRKGEVDSRKLMAIALLYVAFAASVGWYFMG
jgi:cation:H+ antiporter